LGQRLGQPGSAEWPLEYVRSDAAAAGARSPRRWKGDMFLSGEPISLTRRQLEILRLLAVGKTTDDIAIELSLSSTTVRNHIANLLAALGVHSRLQAVLAASKAGLVDV